MAGENAVRLLHGQMQAAGIPIVGVSFDGERFIVQYAEHATAQHRTDGDAAAANWTLAAADAEKAASRQRREAPARQYAAAKSQLDEIVADVEGATAAQTQTAVRQLAVIVLRLLEYAREKV